MADNVVSFGLYRPRIVQKAVARTVIVESKAVCVFITLSRTVVDVGGAVVESVWLVYGSAE